MRTVILEEHFSLPAASARVDKATMAAAAISRERCARTCPIRSRCCLILASSVSNRWTRPESTSKCSRTAAPVRIWCRAPMASRWRVRSTIIWRGMRQISRSLCGLCLAADAKPRRRRQGAASHGKRTRLCRRDGQRHDRRTVPRPSELRRHPCGGRRTGRPDLHPSAHSAGCVREAYFSGLPEGAGRVLETAGWGWHSEVAVHVLRMVVAGTLDKHPKLKLIIGHMGEMLPMMLDRASQVFPPT